MILGYRVTAHTDRFTSRLDAHEGVKSFNATEGVKGLIGTATFYDGSTITYGPNYYPDEMTMEVYLYSDCGRELGSEIL